MIAPDAPSRPARRRPGGGPALLAIACLAALLAGGCRTPDPGRTGGISLRYERRTEPVGVAIWTVETDGTVTYAGGRDVVLGRTTWSGVLDPDDIRRLEAAVAPVRVAGAGATGEGVAGSEGIRTVLDLRTADGRRRIAVDGDPEVLSPLLELLREVAIVRLDPVLERLPRPTEPAGAPAP